MSFLGGERKGEVLLIVVRREEVDDIGLLCVPALGIGRVGMDVYEGLVTRADGAN